MLVTGGAGAIGSNLCRALLDLGADVTAIDDLSCGRRWTLPRHTSFRLLRGDICDDKRLSSAFEGCPSIIFHLAAFFANQNSIEHPERDLHTNALGTLRVLEHALRNSATTRVVFASSSAIYGSVPQLPVTEDAISLDLATPYQITKTVGEMYSTYFHRMEGLPVVRARLFNSYGPGELPGRYRNVVPNFIYRAMTGESLEVTGASATRDMTFVSDIVDGLLACGHVGDAVGEAFNIGTGREVSIRTLAQKIVDETQSSSAIKVGDRRPWDTKPRLRASIDKARTVLGYTPHTELDTGLHITIEWFRANWTRITTDSSIWCDSIAGKRS